MLTSHYETSLNSIIDASVSHFSDILPSDWYEQNMVMPVNSALPGKFSFDTTPYWREAIDCGSPYHPAKEVTIMSGAQVGKTAGVILGLIGYSIKENPGNMMLLTGHSDLSEEAMIKVDGMIDQCGLRDLIKSTTLRAKNSRTGDTNKSKEFPGGSLKVGSVSNHKLLRQHDIMIMIVDDFDAAPASSKHAGSTREMVQQRTAAYAHKRKIYWVSSPETKEHSNIEATFLMGDQRYYNVPCPKCGDFIVLKWSIPIEGSNETAGIYYEHKNGRVIKDSVGYVCQSCGGFFDDTHKYEMNLNGLWVPTCEAKEENHYSYQISSLYSPPYMDGWAKLAQQHLNANPDGGKTIERKMQAFVNLRLGETYERKGSDIKANTLQKNCRKYDPGVIPDQMSMDDGNGRIVLLTCAADVNGKLEDGRLDYEIVGWSESGSSYSIQHGSIGTFVPAFRRKEKEEETREKWTYEHHKPNSVWPKFKEILDTVFETDTGRKMKIFISGVDTGYLDEYIWPFIDGFNGFCTGLKGDGLEESVTRYGKDSRIFKHGQSRKNLYLLHVNQLKENLSEQVAINWNKKEKQEAGFMNFPSPSKGLYQYENYFKHYEAEHRVVEDKGDMSVGYAWKKKIGNWENHLFDCRVYNMALKEILTELVCKELGIKEYSWAAYVQNAIPK